MDKSLTPTEYRLLTEHSPVMVWRAGQDSHCDYFNGTWLSFTGRTLEQEVGTGWAAGVHSQDLDRCIALYLDHFQRRQPFEMEYRLRRHDGEYRWIFDRGVPFMDDAGAFAGFIGSCVDVHERHLAQEAQRRDSALQVAQARDFQNLILAIVSHDIRNPLHTIQLAVRALQNSEGTSSKAEALTQAISRGVTRIQDIVGDLLDLTREREGGGIPIEPKPMHLGTVCQQTIGELQPTSKARPISFNCKVDPEGTWDEHRIAQAVSNLLANAIEHGSPGTPVHMCITEHAGRVAVEIRNQGVIPPALLPQIFEPFQSIRRGAHRGEGLGLGLFIARAIARAHGGDIEVESQDPETMFRLQLPRHGLRADLQEIKEVTSA